MVAEPAGTDLVGSIQKPAATSRPPAAPVPVAPPAYTLGEQVATREAYGTALAKLAVDVAAQLQVLRVGCLVRGHDPRPDRAVRVERLAHHEGLRMELPVARGDVVGDEIAEYVVQRVVLADLLRAGADHHPQLDLVIELLGDARLDVVIRPGKAGRLLVEPHLVRRALDAELVGFLQMLRVVHPDREILGRSLDRRKQVHVGERRPRLGGIGEGADLLQRLGTALDDAQHGRETRPVQSDHAIVLDRAEVRRPVLAVAYQLHAASFVL